MSFRDNLQHLRAERNMTQEQLAMFLGVSRQSVSKWEAERAYPEMDKLLRLCDLFGCTLDELVTGDVTGRAPASGMGIPRMPEACAPQDVTGYDQAMRTFAWQVPLGVTIALAGTALSFLLTGILATVGIDAVTYTPAFVLASVAVGLAVILPAAFSRRAFRTAHPYVEDFYTHEQKAQTQASLTRGVVAGDCVVVAGAAAAVVLQGNVWFASAAFCACAAAGTFVTLRTWLLYARCDVARYNLKSLGRMDDAGIDAFDDEELRATARRARRDRSTCTVIMSVATAVGLVLLFIPMRAVQSCFWLAWVVGGLACVAVRAWHRSHSDK